MDLRVAFLVESWGEPWNEGYKNLAKYVYEILKKHLNVEVLEKGRTDLSKLKNYDIAWIFNYPENAKTFLNLLNLKRINKEVKIVKEVAKRELDVGFKSKVKTILLRRKLWDIVVTTTDLLKLELTRLTGKQPFLLPPPIPVGYFKPLNKNEARELLEFEEDKIHIGYMGTINKYRKLGIIFEALKNAELKNIVLTMALTNVQEKDLSSVLRESGEVRIPLRFVRTHDVRTLFSALDLVVYPVEREGSVEPPLTVLEAMSCGTQVAALRTLITEKIIQDHQDGFLFSTPQELKTIIREVSEDTMDKSKISVNARKKILEKFGPEKVEKAYLEFLRILRSEG
ncbi:MAG: glycosyltransferase [Candidatus Bathyarchaeia archaeon]